MSETLALHDQTPTALSLADAPRFEHIQRVAKMFADSQLVPTTFQKNVPNVVIALEMSQRIGCSPLMVMQNLNVIHGKPSFGSSFMIATVNACGRFTPMRFVTIGEKGNDDWGCYAVAKAKVDGAECKGVTVTFGIAKAEGWVGKTGSKWKTMPELMLQYRAATWWTRMYAPELLMGFPTEDEAIDITAITAPAAAAGEAGLPPKEEGTVVKGPKKGVNAARSVTPAPEAPPSTPPPAAEPAKTEVVPEPPKQEAKATPPPAEPPVVTPPPAAAATPPPAAEVEDAPAPAAPPKKLRVSIVDATEKQAKKAGGVIGPVCTVRLTGDYEGSAYFDGEIEKLPANGAVIDVVLAESSLRGAPVKILTSFEVLA